MSRIIPVDLLPALGRQATTRCKLLRIAPPRDAVFGFCSSNRAITYDDGAGEVVYQVMSGFDVSAIVSTGDTSVDNSQAKILALANNPVTEAKINAGDYDGAEFVIYEVDYTDLSLGHRVVQAGYLGRANSLRSGVYTFELRALLDLLRQEPWEKWQIPCRVRKFGSQEGEERFYCGVDVSGEWITDVVVTAVGEESNRHFIASSLTQDPHYFAPGLVTWTTGNNAGLSFEVETFADYDAGEINLGFPTPYPVQEGDEFDIRRECSRNWAGHNSCDTFGNRPNYRGEPKIAPADAPGATVPGVQVGAGSGGESYTPDPEAAAP